MAQPLGLTASDLVFDEATPEQRLLAWELCAQSWARPMSATDYIERERQLAEHDLNRDGGCRHWVLYLKGYPRQLIASCESARRPVLISDGPGEPCRKGYGYAVTNVYTAPSYRRQGYAAYLLRCVQERMDAESDFSVLYSDSGRRYYAGLGWIPFASRQATITLLTPQSPPHLQIPRRLFTPVSVKTRPLQAAELPALCEADCQHLTTRTFPSLCDAAANNNHDDRTRIAFLPTHALISWHLASAEFDAAKMFPASSPASKPVPGAIVTPSGRAWACWAHDWRGRRLRVLRIAHAAAEDPGAEDGGASPPRTAVATAAAAADVAALLEAAVDEARRCGLRSVTVWNPDEVVRAGCFDPFSTERAARNANTMAPLQPLTINTPVGAPGRPDPSALLSPAEYDADAISIRSDQDTDSEDDERQLRARNSRELRAHDRLVLMEEEELEEMVAEARRKQERQRRGSGLPIPNPLRLLTRRLSDASPLPSPSISRSPSTHLRSSDEDLALEKRRARRERRRRKRDRLLAEAQHGEDGELMYEMEEGGMKDGSSTGESSERDDSDEVDRKHLLHVTALEAKRKRNCRRWTLIYGVIAVAFAILVGVAWKLSQNRGSSGHANQALVSNGTALFAPTTIIISLDGFRADFLNRGLTPRLNAMIKDGVSPLYMRPSFPSVTFPNHHTIATGLYPESHGIVGNAFFDPTLQESFSYGQPAKAMDPKWWQGEPFWITAQKQGLKTAMHMWPGSEAHVLGIDPTYLDRYNGKQLLTNKVDRIFAFLDMPDDNRPQIIAAYVPNVDSDGHKYGPNSTEIRFTIQKVDKMLDMMFTGLEARNLTNIVNVIVVSDHGMATTDVTRLIQLEDLVDLDKIEHTDGWPLMGLRPKNPDELEDIYKGVLEKTKDNPNVEVYLRDVNMPERYHFSKNPRIAPLWIVPKAGWAIVKKDELDVKKAQAEGTVYNPRGLHGYDHEHPLMRAIFIARGPAFKHPPNSRVEVFQNIEVYNLLCDSVGITPAPNNGTLRLPLKTIGFHDDPADTPVDPPESHTLSATPSSSPAPKPTPTKTKSILINPVTTSSSTSTAPANSIGVDEPVPQPSSGSGDDGDGDGDGNDSTLDKIESGVKDFWDWFSGKVTEWWGKVTGNGKGKGEQGDKAGDGEDGNSPA
ncbi:hypothetical protein VTJ49DRAFT_3978 [Mycothermus thermophilus]|uniref:Uncharacterized protein n=1 Tax=Humicola insolens TaxID=85995 RepID=A0ABR3V6H6_HUMIN